MIGLGLVVKGTRDMKEVWRGQLHCSVQYLFSDILLSIDTIATITVLYLAKISSNDLLGPLSDFYCWPFVEGIGVCAKHSRGHWFWVSTLTTVDNDTNYTICHIYPTNATDSLL